MSKIDVGDAVYYNHKGVILRGKVTAVSEDSVLPNEDDPEGEPVVIPNDHVSIELEDGTVIENASGPIGGGHGTFALSRQAFR